MMLLPISTGQSWPSHICMLLSALLQWSLHVPDVSRAAVVHSASAGTLVLSIAVLAS